MPSLARHLFEVHATPTLLSFFGDTRVRLTYRIGDTVQAGIVGVIRDRQIAMEMDSAGDAIKQERCTVVISTDPGSPWGGVESPQLKATWEIAGDDGVSTTWGVDPYPGRGIEAISESLALIHLVRMYGMAKSIPNYRPQ